MNWPLRTLGESSIDIGDEYVKVFRNIDNRSDTYLAAPFIYKIDPNNYPVLMGELVDNPHLFDDVERLRDEILMVKSTSSAFDHYTSIVRKYQPMVKSWSAFQWELLGFRGQLLAFLQEMGSYRHFFRELAAGLRFNPLAARSSAREIRDRLCSLLDAHLNLIQPKALYRSVTATIDVRGVSVKGTGVCFESGRLKTHLANNGNKPVVYIVTIGPRIDRTVKSLMDEGQVLDAYLLNGIGAGATEMVAFDLNLYMDSTFLKNRNSAKYQRFSPGFGDWPVKDQRKLFALLEPEDHVGVVLTEGDIMIPEKSTTGIMFVSEKSTVPVKG